MTMPVFARRHPLLDGRHPAQLYLQHGATRRWGRYLYTGAFIKVAFPNGECTWWDRNAICASVVTARRIW